MYLIYVFGINNVAIRDPSASSLSIDFKKLTCKSLNIVQSKTFVIKSIFNLETKFLTFQLKFQYSNHCQHELPMI